MKKTLTLLAVVTLCFSFLNAQVYLSEDFESGTATGWTQQTLSTDGGWLIGTDLSSSYFPIPSHTTYAGTNDDACNCDKSRITSFRLLWTLVQLRQLD